MLCANKIFASIQVGSQTALEQDESERMVRESSPKRLRREIEPRFIRDRTHVDPEYVWGDEGPIND